MDVHPVRVNLGAGDQGAQHGARLSVGEFGPGVGDLGRSLYEPFLLGWILDLGSDGIEDMAVVRQELAQAVDLSLPQTTPGGMNGAYRQGEVWI